MRRYRRHIASAGHAPQYGSPLHPAMTRRQPHTERSPMAQTRTDTSSISFTAHYTGQVWYRNGLSAEPFYTRQGDMYYRLLAPFEVVGGRLVGTNIRESLLQRHFL